MSEFPLAAAWPNITGKLLHFPRRKVHLSDMAAVYTALAGEPCMLETGAFLLWWTQYIPFSLQNTILSQYHPYSYDRTCICNSIELAVHVPTYSDSIFVADLYSTRVEIYSLDNVSTQLCPFRHTHTLSLSIHLCGIYSIDALSTRLAVPSLYPFHTRRYHFIDPTHSLNSPLSTFVYLRGYVKMNCVVCTWYADPFFRFIF